VVTTTTIHVGTLIRKIKLTGFQKKIKRDENKPLLVRNPRVCGVVSRLTEITEKSIVETALVLTLLSLPLVVVAALFWNYPSEEYVVILFTTDQPIVKEDRVLFPMRCDLKVEEPTTLRLTARIGEEVVWEETYEDLVSKSFTFNVSIARKQEFSEATTLKVEVEVWRGGTTIALGPQTLIKHFRV